MTDTDKEFAALVKRLREPFPKEVIGKLPKLTCRSCSNGNGSCDVHKKARCNACGNFISTAHIDLDFVGHAVVTDRLLSVDPQWTWEPLSLDDRGLPAYDNAGGLWIRLTVCGVTRLGYGDGPDPKQRIGDALRNAAMRFGVALDLWAKDGLESETHQAEKHDDAPTAPVAEGEWEGWVSKAVAIAEFLTLAEAIKAESSDVRDACRDYLKSRNLKSPLTKKDHDAFESFYAAQVAAEAAALPNTPERAMYEPPEPSGPAEAKAALAAAGGK